MTEQFDRDAADRVLRRASELAEIDIDPVDGIEPAALISAAAEVGIPERAVRESLAIEQLGPPPPARRLDAVVGPATIHDQRVVRSDPERVLDLLDRWLVSGHHLRRERRRPGEIEWSRRDDLVGSTRRRLRGLKGEGRLGDVYRIRATVSPIDGDDTLVRVTIDRSDHRRTTLVGGSALGGGGLVIGVVGVVLTAPIAFAAIPAAVAGGYVVSSGRNQAGRFERELPRVLDEVEAGRTPQGFLRGVRRLSPGRSA